MQTGGSADLARAVRSMTGFGRASKLTGDLEVATEVRTVNHRFLDVSMRLPRYYSSFEPHLRKIVAESVQRGKVEVSVSRSGGTGAITDVAIDYGLAERYHACLGELKTMLGLAGDITISDMLTLKDVVLPKENEQEIQKELPVVEDSLRDALKELTIMRSGEGAALWNDIEMRIDAIHNMAEQILPLKDQVVENVHERLGKRVQELTGGIELDEDRLVQEIALFADRADVTEEVTRLTSHVDRFRSFGIEGSPMGRKLDFLLQEIHREVNTIGAKSAATEIAGIVVAMKTEVEKIREQTQNIE